MSLHARTLSVLVPAVAVLGAAVPVASGDLISIVSQPSGSTEGLGAFTGSLNFTPTGAGSATLSVSLTNTSEFAGGEITGFVFQVPSADPLAMAAMSSASVTHPLFLDTGPADAAPFGMFDAGAALGGDWLGGGSPGGGIGIGETGVFQFGITGEGIGGNSAASFVPEGGPLSFIVRFRGFDNGGSDKVPGVQTIVPGPGTAALLAFSACIAAGRRRGR